MFNSPNPFLNRIRRQIYLPGIVYRWGAVTVLAAVNAEICVASAVDYIFGKLGKVAAVLLVFFAVEHSVIAAVN